MEDFKEMASTPFDKLPAPRGRRWLLIGGLAFAFMLALGIGVLMGSATSVTQAATFTPGSSQVVNQGGFNSSQGVTFAAGDSNSSQSQAAMPGTRGQCEMLTVSSVNGNTIVAKTANGSSVTIHTAASTRYTQAGKTVAASAIKVGTVINVMGTHNSGGSITATSIGVG